MTRLVALFLIMACTVAMAGPSFADRDPERDPARYAYRQKPGARLPTDLVFRDADDRPVRLGDLAHGVPLILVPAYLHCANLCSQVRASLLRGLERDGLEAGRDYVLAVLSIDPGDTAADAAAARAVDVTEFGDGHAEPGWHYLTGAAPDIAAVTDAVGFRDRPDPATRQFIHPAGVVFVTPDGRVANYLLGGGYTPAAIREALHGAGISSLAAVAAPVLLICFHFDTTTGRYTLEIMKVLRLAALLTVLTIAGALILLHGRERIAR